MPWYDEQEDGFEALIAYREPTDGTPAHPREQAAARPSAGQKESVCAIGQATEQAHALEEAKRFAEAEERAKARLAAQALKKRESEPCQSPEVREAKHRLAAIHQLHEDIRHPDVPEHRRQEYKRRLAALQMLDMCVDPGGTLLE